MNNLAGQTIKGYDLQERIGAGGFGAVYRAVQSTVGREVAVKIFCRDSPTNRTLSAALNLKHT
jgi:serine/threonine protein kinase